MARDYLSMNRDDERASRAFALAVRFFGSSYPISSDVLNAEFYPALSHESFSRTFLRDRELLASCGLHIRDASGGKAQSWEVDEEASYSSAESLEGPDALAIAILCQDLSRDPSFAWRGELRMALAKIGYATQGMVVSRGSNPQRDPKYLATLVSCHANRHLAHVTYRTATGRETNRDLAIYGSFGLRGHTYFVAVRTDDRDASADNPPIAKTYRLDRFVKVREVPDTDYRIPEDFDADDYRRLPFQMGPSIAVGTFAVPEKPGRTLRRFMGAHGTTRRAGQQLLWDVPFSDMGLAASWAIGEEALPLDPPELVDAYHACLQGSLAQTPAEAFDDRPQEHRTPRRRAGRTGSSDEVRQLVALASNLTKSGRILTADSISSALGVDNSRARHLITLLSMSSGESIDYLPVIVSEDDDAIELMEDANLAARRVRLTPTESHALLAALSELGIPEDDPLYRSLFDAFASHSVNREEILRTIEAPRVGTEADTLARCSYAIGAHRILHFDYTPVSGNTKTHRTVVPLVTRRGSEAWYLDAYDLDRAGKRVFRVDHMERVEEGDVVDSPAPYKFPAADEAHGERVTFSRRAYLDLFDWDAVEVLSEDSEGIHCIIPRYHGPWFARHIVACGGAARCGEELTAEVHAMARELLARH